MKIGFIGAGKMAQAIISGLSERSDIKITSRDYENAQEIAKSLGLSASKTNAELVHDSDIIVLAVKPQVLPKVLAEIKTELSPGKTLVSIAAGYKLETLSSLTSPEQAIIRVMPNVNAAIGQSTTAIVRNGRTDYEVYQEVLSIFWQIGSVHELEEKDFSTFTALAGSSPAYIYMFIDALARAGVLHGLPKDLATKIVAETLAASANNVLLSGVHPQALADSVASPAGTTIEGIVALENHGFTAAVIAAISATIDKEKTLS